ncbi:hypothetical protein [Sphingobacterium sp. LRF_L2]|uniref:hypothetical protein n=1 Tax=Sphingobacterium sp. LRF_L2 TaxID=3369421 RepID=UPI003F60FC4A
MERLLKLVQETNGLDTIVKKYTLLVDENKQEHGVLFFIEVQGKSYKITIPSPHHKIFLEQIESLTIRTILQHKEAMLLK